MGNLLGRPSSEEQPGRRKRKAGQRKKKKDAFLDSNRKRPEPEEEDEEDGPQIKLQDMYERLPYRRLATRKTLSVARWHPDRGLAEAMVMKGNMWQNMGIVRHGRNYCQVEEALYMVERGSLLLLLGPEAASIQQVYSLLLHQGRPLQAYTVYSKLRKLGYVIQRYGDPWVHPVSQNRRKIEAEKKEGSTEAEEKSEEDGASKKAELAESKGKKEKKGQGGEAKKKEKGTKGRKDGSSKQGPSESSPEQADEVTVGEKSLVAAEDNHTEESALDAGNLINESQGAANAIKPTPLAVSAERAAGLGDANESSSVSMGTTLQQHLKAENGAALSSAAGGDVDERASLNGDCAPKGGTDSQVQPEPSSTLQQEAEPGLESGPALTEETVANAVTEDFRKASQEKGPRKKKNPLDLNQACTFVNLNVKNYHPLAPYLFLGKPKKRYAGRKQAQESRGAANGESGKSKNKVGLGTENEQGGNKDSEVPEDHESAATQNAKVRQGEESSVQLLEADVTATQDTEKIQGGEDILELPEAVKEAPVDEVKIDILPADAVYQSRMPRTHWPANEKRTPVDVGALHQLLDMSRCTMPPPIPKSSTWQKLIWRLRRMLMWRWWPWRWGREANELGLGGTMRPLPRPLGKKADEPRGKRVFPETSVRTEAFEGQKEQRTDNYPELKVANENERLAQIAAGKSVVYDIWQPNSRFRKTDPGPPFFRLILGGRRPPTRREVHVYKSLYGQDGVPLKYCFIESTGASTYFSYDPVAVPPVL